MAVGFTQSADPAWVGRTVHLQQSSFSFSVGGGEGGTGTINTARLPDGSLIAASIHGARATNDGNPATWPSPLIPEVQATVQSTGLCALSFTTATSGVDAPVSVTIGSATVVMQPEQSTAVGDFQVGVSNTFYDSSATSDKAAWGFDMFVLSNTFFKTQ